MERRSIALEHLEGRTLFNVVGPMDLAPVMASTVAISEAQVASASHSPLAGAFNVAGTFTHPLGNPDAGAQYEFTGSGKTKALGNFSLSGHIQTPGFVANGRATGRLTITNAHGTIILARRDFGGGPSQIR